MEWCELHLYERCSEDLKSRKQEDCRKGCGTDGKESLNIKEKCDCIDMCNTTIEVNEAFAVFKASR